MSMDFDFAEIKRDWIEQRAADLRRQGMSLSVSLTVATERFARTDLNRVCLAMMALEEAHAAQSRQILVVEKFINERSEYITALKDGGGGDSADYYRWTGNAEGRRQLATDLNWTVPHNPGERTAPKPPVVATIVEPTDG